MTRIILLALTLGIIAFNQLDAQSAKTVGKLLDKSMKETRKSNDIPIPGLSESDRNSGSGLELSNAVGSAVGGVLKGGTKALGWATKGLGPVQLTKVATSGSPFSTLLQLKGKNARKDFENLLGNKLDETGALDLLDQAEGLTGFDLPGGGKDKNKFIGAVTDNTIGALDKKGASLLKGAVK